jgi:hypothetical protein
LQFGPRGRAAGGGRSRSEEAKGGKGLTRARLVAEVGVGAASVSVDDRVVRRRPLELVLQRGGRR